MFLLLMCWRFIISDWINRFNLIVLELKLFKSYSFPILTFLFYKFTVIYESWYCTKVDSIIFRVVNLTLKVCMLLQECFKSSWNEHKKVHKKSGTQGTHTKIKWIFIFNSDYLKLYWKLLISAGLESSGSPLVWDL